ncbi:hypothetical protein FRC12_021812 [Ceratobasidium sp. 428]|nr:hypothetical protein FRC12_021812 [Ceratobasidium sp. 428]
MPHFRTDPNSHALFIPELLDLIGDLLDLGDWLALMQTCQSIFPTMTSRIWKEVEAQVIMDLIVETPQTSESQSSDSNSIVGLVQSVWAGVKLTMYDRYPTNR